MKIAFLVNKVFEGWSPQDTRLGGTEEGIVNWSRLLAEAGHTVTVFQNGFIGFDGEMGEVEYVDRAQYPDNAHLYDVTLNHKALDMPVIGKTYYFTTETDASSKDLSGFTGVVWPSQWAADNIPVNNPNVYVINYGYDPERIYPGKKIPKQCLYASSPDRGLDTLLSVWSDVHDKHPDATLIVTYGATGEPMPGVMYMGSVDEETMDELYRTSDYWVHPCNGGELFGITAIKAQAAGCWPVYFPTMALSETVRHGTKSTPETFTEDLIAALDMENPGILNYSYPTWESTAQDILNLVSPTSSARVEGE